MIKGIRHPKPGDSSLVVSGSRSGVQETILKYRTTTAERFLLMVTVAVLPFQSYLPKVKGVSMLFIMFGVLGAYLVVWRPRILGMVSQHPVFLSGYALVSIGFIMEIGHGNAQYYYVARIGFMIVGAIIVASLCRDRSALLSGIYGILLGSLVLSIVIYLTAYGILSSLAATDYQMANSVRRSTFSGDFLGADLNYMAFLAAQGAVVALALTLTAQTISRRYVFMAIGAFCFLASFLPMSRGAAVILALSCAAIVYTNGIMKGRVIIVSTVFAVVALVWIPEVVFSRFGFTTGKQAHGRIDGRARVYTAVIKHFPEYVLTGVGRKNFYGAWGRRTGFAKGNHVTGTHNIFAQVTVFWGLPALFAVLALVRHAYRCVPKRFGADPLGLCVLGIVIAVFLESLVVQVIEGKEFSIALGMLVGVSLWIRGHPMNKSRIMVRTPPHRRTPAMSQRITSFNLSNHSIKPRSDGFRP